MLLQIVQDGDKIFAIMGRRVGIHGRVKKVSDEYENPPRYRIVWEEKDHKRTEEVLKVNTDGLPVVPDPVLLLDREYKIGSRVRQMNTEGVYGTVVGVEKVATLSLEPLDKNPKSGIKLEKIPLKLLKRPLDAEIGQKYLWNHWLGKIKDLSVKIVYYFEESGAVCSISGEERRVPDNQSHDHPFPFVGQQFGSLKISDLWDADWPDNKWFRNMFKFSGKKAKVIDVVVDSITPEWIKMIPYDDGLHCPAQSKKSTLSKVLLCPASSAQSERSTLPKALIGNDLEKVICLYGHEYTKMGERSLCKYTIQGTEQVACFKNNVPERMTVSEYAQLENKNHKLEIHEERVFTVSHTWNKYLVQWSNGVQESCYVQENDLVAAAVDPSNISLIRPLSRGNIVEMLDCEPDDDNAKFGIVLGQDEDTDGMVRVKWVTPRESTVHMEEIQNSRYDLRLSENYQFLEDLASFPIVLIKRSSEVGVVTGLEIESAKLQVKLPNGTEIFPYIHESKHISDECVMPPCCDDDDEAVECIKDDRKDTEKINLEQLSFDPMTQKGGYLVSDELNSKHFFYELRFNPRMNDYKYLVAWQKELDSFNDMPEGIWIQGFANRSDLFTAIIRGNAGTPYQDALLVFDVALPQTFPAALPHFIFKCFHLEINPMIYSTGEVYMPRYDELVPLPSINENPCIIKSSLSWIKDEILVKDPYYLACKNGRSSGDTFADVNCKRYNEFILLNLLTYQQKIVKNLPPNWENFFMKYYCENLPKMVQGYESLLLRGGLPRENNVTERGDSRETTTDAFYISLRSRLNQFRLSTFLN